MKTSKKILAAAVAFTTAISFSAAASATVFVTDYHDAGVWNAYDTETETYAMKFRSDLGKDGFWLVVTDGDNPKGDGQSHAILYGDLNNNKITAYTYDGDNSSNSYETGVLLGTYENAFSSGGTHSRYGYDLTMFSLDVSGINGLLGDGFDGVVLGEKSGIWFHQSAGSNFSYGEDGSIIDYGFDSQMWLDRGNVDYSFKRESPDCATNPANAVDYVNSCSSTQIADNSGAAAVPAPGGLALILIGLAGLGRRAYRKSA